jgi:nicotinate phosphoribosyltransferase
VSQTGDVNLTVGHEVDAANSPLLTDFYELNMIQAYLDHGETDTAVFEYFVRKLPPRRGFLLAAGLSTALDYLERLRFSDGDLAWLAGTGRFKPNLIDYLAGFRFTGEVHAMPEGTVFFPDEPILRVTAPLPEAQLVESRLINILHFQTVIASKAARMVLAASGKLLVDFGLRNAHGAEAGLLAARASYIAGFAGTATVLANQRFGIPMFGTMAHSFVQVHDDESAAFDNFARARPDNITLLLDTYDVEAAARKVVALAKPLAAEGITIRGVRLDSGDLDTLSRRVRTILDEGGLAATNIVASGNIDEDALAMLIAAGAPIDSYGIGTSLTVAPDAPVLDSAYKIQEYAGRPRRKHASGKTTWPGRKQVWRRFGADGRMAGDIVSIDGDRQPGELLIVPVMRGGRRLAAAPTLADIRIHASEGLARLPEPLHQLWPDTPYPVAIASALSHLAAETDRRLGLAGP